MAFQLSNFIQPQYAPNSLTTMYGPFPGWSRIDALVVANTDSVARTITIHLVPPGGSADATNITTDAQTILPAQTWVSPNEIGQVIEPGGLISVIASAASVLIITASGLTQI